MIWNPRNPVCRDHWWFAKIYGSQTKSVLWEFSCVVFFSAKFRKSSFRLLFQGIKVLYQLLFSVKERVLTDYSVSPRKLETCHPNYLKNESFVSPSLLRLPNTTLSFSFKGRLNTNNWDFKIQEPEWLGFAVSLHMTVSASALEL